MIFLHILSLEKRLKNTKYTNMFNLWNIQKRTHECDEYQDKEMTDDEKEEEKLIDIESSSIKLQSRGSSI